MTRPEEDLSRLTPISELLVRLARDEKITAAVLHESLRDICDAVHATCDDECPVFALHGGLYPDGRGGCWCCKDGRRMASVIREKRRSR